MIRIWWFVFVLLRIRFKMLGGAFIFGVYLFLQLLRYAWFFVFYCLEQKLELIVRQIIYGVFFVRPTLADLIIFVFLLCFFLFRWLNLLKQLMDLLKIRIDWKNRKLTEFICKSGALWKKSLFIFRIQADSLIVVLLKPLHFHFLVSNPIAFHDKTAILKQSFSNFLPHQ